MCSIYNGFEEYLALTFTTFTSKINVVSIPPYLQLYKLIIQATLGTLSY